MVLPIGFGSLMNGEGHTRMFEERGYTQNLMKEIYRMLSHPDA